MTNWFPKTPTAILEYLWGLLTAPVQVWNMWGNKEFLPASDQGWHFFWLVVFQSSLGWPWPWCMSLATLPRSCPGQNFCVQEFYHHVERRRDTKRFSAFSYYLFSDFIFTFHLVENKYHWNRLLARNLATSCHNSIIHSWIFKDHRRSILPFCFRTLTMATPFVNKFVICLLLQSIRIIIHSLEVSCCCCCSSSLFTIHALPIRAKLWNLLSASSSFA